MVYDYRPELFHGTHTKSINDMPTWLVSAGFMSAFVFFGTSVVDIFITAEELVHYYLKNNLENILENIAKHR